jgi:lipoprotein NlpI
MRRLGLDPKSADGYFGRCVGFANRGTFESAFGDCNDAIQLNPKISDAFKLRGTAWYARGYLNEAIADYSEAIKLDPKNSVLYRMRGSANFYGGSIPEALSDLRKAIEIDPNDAYAVLWLDLASRRWNLSSRLSETIAGLDMIKWPAPLVRMFLGESTLQNVIAAIDNSNEETRRERNCEANFFGAQLQSRKEDTLRLLRLAESDCPKYLEWIAANIELNTPNILP